MNRRIEVYATDWDHPLVPKVKIDITDIPIYVNENTQNFRVHLNVYNGDTRICDLTLQSHCNRTSVSVLKLFGTMAKLKLYV
jgi:hypothetical protein